MRYRFRIPIGDYSNDGHGRCRWFTATANKPIEKVQQAYERAAKQLGWSPDDLYNRNREWEITRKMEKKLLSLGAPIDVDNKGDIIEEMAGIVVWYLNKADPQLVVMLKENPPIFTGVKGHQIGYGLFE